VTDRAGDCECIGPGRARWSGRPGRIGWRVGGIGHGGWGRADLEPDRRYLSGQCADRRLVSRRRTRGSGRDRVAPRRRALYLGAPQAITRRLEQAGLRELAQYYHPHQRRMHASRQEFQEQVYPIGSGTVEGGTLLPRPPALSGRWRGQGFQTSPVRTGEALVPPGGRMNARLAGGVHDQQL